MLKLIGCSNGQEMCPSVDCLRTVMRLMSSPPITHSGGEGRSAIRSGRPHTCEDGCNNVIIPSRQTTIHPLNNILNNQYLNTVDYHLWYFNKQIDKSLTINNTVTI
jgi:hypothetical protein